MSEHLAIRALVLVGTGVLALVSVACSDPPAVPLIPTGTTRAETPRAGDAAPTAPPTSTTGVVRPAPAAPSTTPGVTSPTPGAPASPAPTAPPPTATTPPAPTPPAGRVEVRAPIERLEVLRGPDDTAVARITSGLPSGCAVYSRAEVLRASDLVRVGVFNYLPAGNVVCTQIYGMVTNDVPLGSGFPSGVVFAIEVNGARSTFTLP